MPSNVDPDKIHEYNQTYYKKHREELLRGKRIKYANDPEYKKRVQGYAATTRLNKKIRAEQEYAATGKRPPGRGGGLKPGEYRVQVGEIFVTVIMWPVGHLAKKLGRRVQTIRNWEKKGVFPKALYRSPGGVLSGNRLYTEFQVEKILQAYNRALQVHGARKCKNRISETIFPELVKKIWEEYPLGIDTTQL